MRWWLVAGVIVVLVVAGGFPLVRWLVVRASLVPTNLGLQTNGRLAACGPFPNCVSSHADPSDAGHYVAPFRASGTRAEAQQRLLNALNTEPRITVVVNEPGYLRAEARSATMGFVDDVEFAFDDAAGVVHVRSAARLGNSDLGVNRARVERLRAVFSG